MLRLAETNTSTYFYHLHEDEGDPKFSGGRLRALCGVTFLGWDTQIPLSTWGHRGHLPSRYCPECDKRKPHAKL